MNALNLWDLSEERVYVKIKNGVIKEFFNFAIKFAGSENKLARLLGKNRIGNIWEFKNDKALTPLNLIVNILNIIPPEKGEEFKNKIENNIEQLRYGYGCAKSIKNPKLPIIFSPVLARIAGHVTGDGGIGMRRGYPVYYTNQCKSLTNEFKEDIIDVFGDVDAYEYYKDSDKTTMIRFPSIVGLILMKFLGPMVGELKHVPDVVLNSDNETKIMFLRAVYDDEGCPSESSNRITFGISNEQVANAVKEMLKEFGIRPGTITKGEATERWSANYQFGIFGRDDVRIFENEIGFNHPEKKIKLSNLVKSYEHKQNRYKNEEIKSLILETINRNNRLNTCELAKKLNRKPSYRFREQLYKLTNAGKIKTITIKRTRFYSLK